MCSIAVAAAIVNLFNNPPPPAFINFPLHTMKEAGPQRSPIRLNQRYTKAVSAIIFYVGAGEECESRKWEKWVALSFTAGGIGSTESHLKKRHCAQIQGKGRRNRTGFT